MKRNKINLLIILVLIILSIDTKDVNADENYLKKIDPANFLTETMSSKINVSSDPDKDRKEFSEYIENPTQQKGPTSITIKPSDQVTNLVSYKKRAQENKTYAAVNSWDTLVSAYNNTTITYIEVLADISPNSTPGYRDLSRNTSIIIDGNGHTINMNRTSFRVDTPASNQTFTITNVIAIQGVTGNNTENSTASDGLIDQTTSRDTGWHYNINDVTLNPIDPNSANLQGRRMLDAAGGSVTLSGTVIANIKQEFAQIGSVEIANGADIQMNRTSGTNGFSMFYFMDNSNYTATDRKFVVGDNVKLTAKELEGYRGNSYPLVYRTYQKILVGDNVEWSQDGFQMLIDTYRGSNTNREVTFGQNLKMIASRTVGSNSLYARNNAKVTFNAGTVLDLEQWNNNYVVNTDAGSSITFVSPKKLHIARNSATGAPTTGSIFYGAGTFSMNNSEIRTWQGSNSESVTPEGNRNTRFTNLTIINRSATVTDTVGNTSSSNIVDTSTRELSTNSIDPGTIKVNYLDQYGNNLKSVQYPINPNDNYIGQFLTLKNKEYAIKNMPDKYMWAIGKQVPTAAISDAQSGGDPTSTSDNGDEFGQVDTIIVPMQGTEYTYNIYVYGIPNNQVQYEYKDIKTGKVLQDEFLNSGKESAGTDKEPSNYGNNINWHNEYYTVTNVPKGYHYAVDEELGDNIQPDKTIVGLNPELKTIYVYPDKQTVIITFETEDGSPLINQISPLSIDGYSGQEISYKDLTAGKITQQGMAVEDGTFIFDFTDNKGSSTDRTPQYLTIKLIYVKVNMSIKQVYKDNNNQLIYKNLESQTIVDNKNNNYLVTIDDSISDVINNLKTKDPSEIQIDYDWYLPIDSTMDYIIMVNNQEVKTDKVPNKDFELLITYSGITNFEVHNLDYGEIPITSTDNKIFDNPNPSQKATIVNTDLWYDWELVVSTKDSIKKNGTSQEYLGGLLVNQNGTHKVIDQSGVKLSSKQDQNNPLISKVPIDIKLFQNTGNTIGSYEGTLLWTLQDTP